MKLLKQLVGAYSALPLRNRVLLSVLVAVGLVVGGNGLLLKPQLLEIKKLQTQESSIQAEMASLRKVLADIKREEEQKIDPIAAERAELARLVAQIAEVGPFMELEQGGSAAISEVGVLVRSLIKANPGLTLVSLKTRPGAVFYTPPAAAPPPKSGVGTEIDKALALMKKEEETRAKPGVVLVKKTIYKHGIEVSVKGAYPALLTYLREMQRFPKQVFWTEATLDAAGHYREATLKLLIHTLSDQPNPPLS